MNKVTEKAFKAVRKATQDSVSGGGIQGSSSGPFRKLWEPEEGDTSFAEIGNLLNRKDLEQGFLQERSKPESKAFNAMRFQMQNDIVAPLHRDLTIRYSSRIHRILEETGRRKNICAKNGLLDLMESNINKFIATTEKQ